MVPVKANISIFTVFSKPVSILVVFGFLSFFGQFKSYCCLFLEILFSLLINDYIVIF